MTKFADMLSPDQVLVNVAVTSKKRAFDEAARLFSERCGLDRDRIVESLVAREQLGSTGLGAGVAVPHARIKGLVAPAAAVLQLAHPIDCSAPDGVPVTLMVCLLVPEAATQLHLELLSEVAALLDNHTMREAMKTSKTSLELYNVIQNAK